VTAQPRTPPASATAIASDTAFACAVAARSPIHTHDEITAAKSAMAAAPGTNPVAPGGRSISL
jgi:hypothetical protein